MFNLAFISLQHCFVSSLCTRPDTKCDALSKRFEPPTRGAAKITRLSGELKKKWCDQCWVTQLRAYTSSLSVGDC